MTRVDRLRKDGWTVCGTCEGTGMRNNGSETSGVGRPDWFEEWLCPDCVDGRVPPDGMVEAAAKAMEQLAPNAPLLFRWHRLARAALVAAARWEAPE